MASSDFDLVVLRGTTYKVPKPDANPPYGEELNDYLKALGDAFATLVGPGDLPETEALINNNQTSPTNVVGLTFDNATIRSAVIEYTIYRETAIGVQKESGEIAVLFDSTQASGFKWEIDRNTLNYSGVDFTITDAGQVQYTSDNMSGTSYDGRIRFQARAIIQS